MQIFKYLAILIILIFISTATKAQEIDTTKKPIAIKTDSITKFNKVDFSLTLIDTISKSKDDLYVNSITWIANNFKSAKDVIQMQDKEAGRIIVRGLLEIDGPSSLFTTCGRDNVNFKITIDLKDNKYRIVFEDFTHEGGYCNRYPNPTGGKLALEKPECGTLSLSKPRWTHIKTHTEKEIRKLLRNYRKSMRQNQPKDDF
jgi:Domain of unknown function (DUF4468) with TBP-like fold